MQNRTNRILCKDIFLDSFIKNRTNMHEMQNRMKIAFCVKPPLPSILLADRGGPREVFGGGGGLGGLAPTLLHPNTLSHIFTSVTILRRDTNVDVCNSVTKVPRNDRIRPKNMTGMRKQITEINRRTRRCIVQR